MFFRWLVNFFASSFFEIKAFSFKVLKHQLYYTKASFGDIISIKGHC